MAQLPGRYDDECTELLEHTHASAVALLVVAGNKGSSVSVKGLPGSVEQMQKVLPDLLRKLAQLIEVEGISASN